MLSSFIINADEDNLFSVLQATYAAVILTVIAVKAKLRMTFGKSWAMPSEANTALGTTDPGDNGGGYNAAKVVRLAFHDCVKYTDGSGGCDGCLNWKGVGAPVPNNNAKNEQFTWEPLNLADNNGLGDMVEALEKIYTTIDWPFKEASLTASLQQLGKSRADLWQFAGLVALERAIERANRACDLDKWVWIPMIVSGVCNRDTFTI